MSLGGGDRVIGAGWGRAQGGKGSQGQLGGVNGGVQGTVVNTRFLQGPCSHCSAPGALWAIVVTALVCMYVHCAWHIKQAMYLLAAAQAHGLCWYCGLTVDY